MFEIFDAKVYSEPFSGKKSIVLHNYSGMESPPIGLLDIKDNGGLQQELVDLSNLGVIAVQTKLELLISIDFFDRDGVELMNLCLVDTVDRSNIKRKNYQIKTTDSFCG